MNEEKYTWRLIATLFRFVLMAVKTKVFLLVYEKKTANFNNVTNIYCVCMLHRDRLENDLVSEDDLMSENLAVEIVSWVANSKSI